MNTLAYSTQDPQTVGAKVEEKLREELGATSPIAFSVEEQEGTGFSAGSLLRGAARALVGGRSDIMYTLVYTIPAPRPAELRAHVARQGIGCHVGGLLYSTRLAKDVAGEVVLDEKKPAFTGDGAAARLNGLSSLMKRIDKLARTKASIGGLQITMPRCARIVPQQGGALFLLGTLGRAHALGFKVSMDAKEFFDVAAAVEAAL